MRFSTGVLFLLAAIGMSDAAVVNLEERAPTQTDLFCSRFKATCYKIAGQVGPTKNPLVTVSCTRLGNSDRFNFVCKADADNITKQVLDITGLPTNQTITYTVQGTVGGTAITTRTVDRTSTKRVTATRFTSTRTIDSPRTGTATRTVTRTVTSRVTATATLLPPAKRDVDASLEAREKIPVEITEVTLPEGLSKRLTINDPSNFCTAYRAACQRQCKRVQSVYDTEICQQRSHSGARYTFALACKCRNGILETQHALQDIGIGVSIVSVNGQETITLATQTVTKTRTLTTTSPVATVSKARTVTDFASTRTVTKTATTTVRSPVATKTIVA